MTPSIIQIAVVTLIAFIYGAEKNAGQILTTCPSRQHGSSDLRSATP